MFDNLSPGGYFFGRFFCEPDNVGLLNPPEGDFNVMFARFFSPPSGDLGGCLLDSSYYKSINYITVHDKFQRIAKKFLTFVTFVLTLLQIEKAVQ